MPRALAVALLAALFAAATAAAADPKAPTQRHTAADMRTAGSIALKRSDLAAGWTLDSPTSPTTTCKAEPDESKLVQTGRVDPSYTYRDGVTNVGSEVDVFKTPQDEAVDWRLSNSLSLRDCLAEVLQKDVKTPVSVSSYEHVKIAPLGARTAHIRAVIVIHAATPATVYADLVAVGRRRATVVLTALTVGRPFPASALSSLAHLLARRLAAAKGI